MRVLFVAAGSPATVFALSPLATTLRHAGHEVLMAAPEGVLPAVTGVGLAAAPTISAPAKVFMTTDRNGDPVRKPTDPAAEIHYTGEWFGRMAAASVEPLERLARAWRPDVLIWGTLCYAAPIVAARLGIPHIRHSWDGKEAIDIDPGADQELRPELDALGLTRIPDPAMFIEVCPPSVRWSGAGPAQPMRWTPGNRQRVVEPWMYTRGERKRVLLTAGSRVVRDLNYAFLRNLVDQVSGVDAELIVAVPENAAADLRKEIPGIAIDWFPLDILAPTCDLIVHHAGGVTALTAMNYGVPQLSIPEQAASNAPAERIAEFGAGITLLPGADTEENIVSACKQILAEDSYRERSLELAAEIHAMPAPAEVARAVEALVAL